MSQHPRYVLGRRVARGGMAEIFLAKAVGSDNFEKLCAVKKILPHYAQEREYIEMFRAEADICKRLQHGNIVQVYDFKRVDDSYAIIMEFVDGTDLRSLLAACEKLRARPSVPMAVYIAIQTARGLHYAHTRLDESTGKALEIVHRDISPQNILLSFEGDVKVIDFGIAKFENRLQETKPGVVKGKYSYMSPEQVAAKPLDARTDIFSLAIVLWETLAMKRLFAAETEVETIKNVQSCIIRRSLMDLNAGVDQELHDIIMRALSRDRKKRFDNAAQLEKELMRYLNRKYPDFSPGDLGSFVKQIFVHKRTETQRFISELLKNKKDQNIDDDSNENKSEKNKGTFAENDTKAQSEEERLAVLRENQAAAQRVEMNLSEKDMEALPLASVLQSAVGSKIVSQQLSAHPHSGTGIGMGSSRTGNETSTETGQRKTGQGQSSPPQSSRGFSQQQREVSRQSKGSGSKRGYRQNPVTWKTAHPVGNHERWDRNQQRNLLFYLSAIGIALGICLIAYFVGRNNFISKDSVQVLLQTNPANVVITIDGKTLDNSNYIETPRRFSLAPGKHEMIVTRAGYMPQRIDISGVAGDVLKAEGIVLKRLVNARMATVDVKANGKKAAYVVINNGQIRGTAPIRATDLEWGKTHNISVFPNYPDRKGAFRCSFTPTPQPPYRPYNLTVELPTGTKPPRCIAN